VTASVAREVARAAEGRPVLGVFGAQPPEEILRLRDATGIAGAQLHGTYDASVARRLGAEGVFVVRVVRLQGAADLDRVIEARDGAAAVLVEPHVAGALGGTGIMLPADLGVAARERLGSHPMFLAGGLTPHTVASAIALIQPDVVDVSSGVERLPGIKDPARIVDFMEAVVGHYPTP
jgi:phosphoribosylanthranilate isomerase